MKLSEVKNLAAPGTVRMPPDCFVSAWDNRPTDDVLFGLRILSAADRQNILKEAAERIKDGGESSDYQESFELAVLRLFCAHVICDPNNSLDPSSIFPHPNDQVFIHLTEGGARRIFDAARRVEVEKSPQAKEATPDELIELIDAIGDGVLNRLDRDSKATVMRHLRYVLDIVRDFTSVSGEEMDDVDGRLMKTILSQG